MDSGIPGFSADAYREMYEKHIRALRSQVAELRKDWPGAKIIVITHRKSEFYVMVFYPIVVCADCGTFFFL